MKVTIRCRAEFEADSLLLRMQASTVAATATGAPAGRAAKLDLRAHRS